MDMYKKLAYGIIAVVMFLSLVHVHFISKLRFDYDFESFFPVGDEDLTYFQEFREKFENDNDFMLIGFNHPISIFNGDFLQRVDSFSKEIASHKNILKLTSPTSISQPVISSAGVFEIPLLHIDQPERYVTDSLRIFRDESLIGHFFSEDGKAIALIAKHPTEMFKPETDSLLQFINQAATTHQLSPIFIAGRIKAQSVYIEKMQSELLIFLSISIVFVIIFLSITYRSIWSVVVPIGIVVLSVIWLLGIMGIFNKPLDLMLGLLPSIMFVVAMSDVVHILTKYIEEIRLGRSKVEAIKIVLTEIGLATFLTSLTTAVGFLTLLTASINPVREFGIYASIGVLIAYLLAFSILPAILYLIPPPRIIQQKVYGERWNVFLGKFFSLILKKRLWVFFISIVIIGLSLFGISKIEINSKLLEDIPNDDPLKKEFTFFDQYFGGSRPIEIAVFMVDTSQTILDFAALSEIQKVEQFLKNEYGAKNIISPLNMVKSINRAVNGGVQSAYVLPKSNRERQRLRKYLSYARRSAIRNQLISNDLRASRISGKSEDIGSMVALEKNKLLNDYVKNHVDTSLINFRITGTSLLIDKNNQNMTANMIEGLIIAFLVIAIIVAILYKSMRMIVIALIPNMLPLIIIAGIMGYFGITLRVSTSVIFTIAFGIAVDDTIHFISKLKLELNKGRSFLFALKNTYFTTGKAIIITTVILSGGFVTLISSSFGGTYYMGLLVSMTLILALVADLTLLPVLLVLFFRRKKKIRK